MSELDALKYAMGMIGAVLGAAIYIGRKLQAVDGLVKRQDRQSKVQKVQGILQLRMITVLNSIASKIDVAGVDLDGIDLDEVLQA